MVLFKAKHATQSANQISFLSWERPGDSHMVIKKGLRKTVKACPASHFQLALTGWGCFLCVIICFYYVFVLHQSL